MSTIPYEVLSFTDWEDAKRALALMHSQWIFRGQGNNEWRLNTSLERAAGNHYVATLQVFEQWVREEFEGGAHHFLGPQQVPTDDIEWLALMQHHGAPTRLLDFTRSPYVAAYFALENAAKWCSIWAVQAIYLQAVGTIVLGGPDAYYQSISHAKYLDMAFGSRVPWVLPVEPRRKNERLLAQQGLFLLPCQRQSGIPQNRRSRIPHPQVPT